MSDIDLADNSHAREAARTVAELEPRVFVVTQAALAVALEVARLREAVLMLVDEHRARR